MNLKEIHTLARMPLRQEKTDTTIHLLRQTRGRPCASREIFEGFFVQGVDNTPRDLNNTLRGHLFQYAGECLG